MGLTTSERAPPNRRVPSSRASSTCTCACARGIPFGIGGCPTAATAANAENVPRLLRQVADERGLRFKLAVITSAIPRSGAIQSRPKMANRALIP